MTKALRILEATENEITENKQGLFNSIHQQALILLRLGQIKDAILEQENDARNNALELSEKE